MRVSRNESSTYQNRQLLMALISMIGFLAITSSIYLVRYRALMDTGLIQYYILFGLMGALSVSMRLYSFGVTFMTGAIIGLIADCVISYLEGPRPTMQGGIYNMLFVFGGAAIGVIAEIAFQRAKRSRL